MRLIREYWWNSIKNSHPIYSRFLLRISSNSPNIAATGIAIVENSGICIVSLLSLFYMMQVPVCSVKYLGPTKPKVKFPYMFDYALLYSQFLVKIRVILWF
ncbi:hypothetical protein C5S29_08870 [ANME-1 cluster archaeon GoMg3.2]|nr:hypothetical protein [ANME-1 cluster archaeon GoMg3.2]